MVGPNHIASCGLVSDELVLSRERVSADILVHSLLISRMCLCSLTRVGVLIFMLHDVNDIFLELAKVHTPLPTWIS